MDDDRAAPPSAGSVEVLVLGPDRGQPRSRSWRRTAAAVLLVSSLMAAATLGSRWWRDTDPTFTTDEIVASFTNPPAPLSGPLRWDTSRLSVDSGAPASPEAVTEPATCGALINPQAAPSGTDVVSVSLSAIPGRDNEGQPPASVITSRYLDPAGARAKFRLLLDSLGSCSSFSQTGYQLHLEPLTAREDRRGRSETSVRLTVNPWSDRDRLVLVLTLLRFGNTVSWVFYSDNDDSRAAGVTGLPDVVIGSLRAVQQKR